MKASHVAVLLFAVAVVASLADETNLAITVDGVTYSNVTFRTVTPSSVSILHNSQDRLYSPPNRGAGFGVVRVL